jgi:hypothetical protein
MKAKPKMAKASAEATGERQSSKLEALRRIKRLRGSLKGSRVLKALIDDRKTDRSK